MFICLYNCKNEINMFKPKGEYNLPAVIAGKEVTIKTDVVESDIPMLLSRQAMKTDGVKIDLESDTAQFLIKILP